MSVRIAALVVAAVGLVAGGCASDPPVAVDGPAAATAAVGSVGGGEVPEVLRFRGALLDGGTLDGASLAGRDVAFWFWAPW